MINISFIISFTVSLVFIASIPSCLITGILMDVIGPKRVCQIIMGLSIGLWILLAYPPNVVSFYVARILLGFLMGIGNTVILPVAAELSEPAYRGILTGIIKMLLNNKIFTIFKV